MQTAFFHTDTNWRCSISAREIIYFFLYS